MWQVLLAFIYFHGFHMFPPHSWHPFDDAQIKFNAESHHVAYGRTYRFAAHGSYATTGKTVGSIVGVLSVLVCIYDSEHWIMLMPATRKNHNSLWWWKECFILFSFTLFLQGLLEHLSQVSLKAHLRMDSKSGSLFVKIQIHCHSPAAEFFPRVTMRSASKVTAHHAIKTMTLDMLVRDMYKLRSDIPCVAALHDFHHFQALLALELLQAAPIELSHFQKANKNIQKDMSCEGNHSQGQMTDESLWLMHVDACWWMLTNAD